MIKRNRIVFIACIAILLAICAVTLYADGAKSSSSPSRSGSSSSSSSSTPSDVESARIIAERKELRDRLIAEKKARKEAEAKAKAQNGSGKENKQENKKKNKEDEKKKSTEQDHQVARKATRDAEVKAKKISEEAVRSYKASHSDDLTPDVSLSAAAIAAAKEYANIEISNDEPIDAELEKERSKRLAADMKERAKSRSSLPDASAHAKKRERLANLRHSQDQRRRLRLEKAQKRAAELKQKRQARTNKQRTQLAVRRKKTDARRKARIEAAKPEIIARGAEKLKWLQNQMKGKGSKVIDISYANFKKYVNTSPRPYWLFVSFTALGSRYGCSICKTVAPEMEKLSSIYHLDRLKFEAELKKNGTTLTSKTVDDFASETEYDAWRRHQMPIFFIQVDIDSNGEVFRLLNMQSAPTMIVMNPTAAATSQPLADLLKNLPSKNRYQLTKADITAADLNEFIQKVTGRTVSLATAREPGLKGLLTVVSNLLNLMDPVRFLLLCVAGVMLCLLLTLWFLQFLYRTFRRYQSARHRRNGIISRELSPSELAPIRIYSQYCHDLTEQSIGTPSLTRSNWGVVAPGAFKKPAQLGLFRWWFVGVGCLVYLFGISGGMFNILRGNSSFSFDFLRNPRSFNIWNFVQRGDSHDQSVMEGFALGLLQLTLASIIIFLNRMSFTTRVVQPSGTPTTAKERTIRIAKWFGNCLFSPIIWATVAFLTWRLIVAIYSKKNGGYRHGFVWKHFQPHHLNFLYQYINRVMAYLPKPVVQALLKVF